MARLFAPGPAMVTFWAMVIVPKPGSPQSRVMVCPVRLGAKTMMSPAAAAPISVRRLPADPSSAAAGDRECDRRLVGPGVGKQTKIAATSE